MALPPPTYFLLIGATLLLVPFVRRRAADLRVRTQIDRVFASMVLLELGLIVLFYSKLVCWLLAGAGSVLLSHTAGPRSTRWAAVGGAAALAFGLLFQFMPEPGGFVVYFSIGLPLLFAVPLVLLVSRGLRYGSHAGLLWSSAGIIAFGALIGASAYAIDFLRRFEVAHLVALAIAAGGLASWGARGAGDITEGLRRSASAMDVGAYVGRRPPLLSARTPFLSFGAAALALAGSWLALMFGAEALGFVALVVAAVAVVMVPIIALTLRRRHHMEGHLQALVSSALAFSSGLLSYASLGTARVAGTWSVPALLTSGLVGVAVVASGLGAALALAVLADGRARLRVLAEPHGVLAAPHESLLGLPRDARLVRATAAPTTGDLRSFAASLRARGSAAGVLFFKAPEDPLWTLPDDVYAWLETENASLGRVHVAVEERDAVYFVPPVVPEEHAA